MGSRFELVDDADLDDKLVESLAAREMELADYEDVIEGLQHMLANAESFVPVFGDAKLDAENLQWFKDMVQKDLVFAHKQQAKSKGIYGGLKARAAKRANEHAAAKERFLAKRAAEKAAKK